MGCPWECSTQGHVCPPIKPRRAGHGLCLHLRVMCMCTLPMSTFIPFPSPSAQKGSRGLRDKPGSPMRRAWGYNIGSWGELDVGARWIISMGIWRPWLAADPGGVELRRVSLRVHSVFSGTYLLEEGTCESMCRARVQTRCSICVSRLHMVGRGPTVLRRVCTGIMRV